MVCDRGIVTSTYTLEKSGVPATAASGVWWRDGQSVEALFGGERGGGRQFSLSTSVQSATQVIDGRQNVYDATEVCALCGSVKDRGETCHHCNGSGEVPSSALPQSVRGVVEVDRITADELATIVSQKKASALSVIKSFPGVAGRLDDEGRQCLFDAARQSPMEAMLGRTPDALMEAGGHDVLAEIAEREPRLAARSLRTSAILGLES